MAKQQEIKGPVTNKLSEKIRDISKIIIPRGAVLLEIVEKNDTGLFLPEGFDKTGYVYFKVVKTGNADFATTHLEYKDEGITKEGNIVLYLRPNQAPILVNKGKEYIIVSETLIESQVTADNFSLS